MRRRWPGRSRPRHGSWRLALDARRWAARCFGTLAIPARLDERAARAHRMRTAQRRSARHDPLGAAPVLAYVLRLRAQVVALRGYLWGVALGVPPAAPRRGARDAA